jgi:hypothetical protein
MEEMTTEEFDKRLDADEDVSGVSTLPLPDARAWSNGV